VTATPAAREGAEAGTARAGGSGNGSVPRHVAIIMDGNGRWAVRRGLPRAAGHRAGAEAVRATLRAAAEAGVEVLTLYAFSSENWRRSEEEVTELKGLLAYYVDKELETLHREGVRLKLIGDPAAFGPQLVERLERAIVQTADNDRLTLVVALNYGARSEIAAAARSLAAEVASGRRDPASIDEQAISEALDTAGLPQLDLLIRTSGEVRLSNFLLWQAAYAELLFVDTLWPDFDEAAFKDALAQFAGRHRRFGGR
jgi:undecaprenyl diphosphate synthase